MPTITVNPEALNTYGTAAAASFEAMATQLAGIVADVNTLSYAGANAKSFKDACGETATSYVTFMNGSLTAMANAIMAATKNIEASLGGASINVHLSEVAVDTAVEDASSDVVHLDQDQLDQTKTNVEGYFNELENQLGIHKKAFDAARAAPWEGNAAEAATEAVTTTTTQAITQTQQARQSIVAFMQSQQDSASSADASFV